MSCSVRVVRACASVTLSECVYTFSKVKRAGNQKHDTRMGENRHQSEQPRSIKGEIDTHQHECMDTDTHTQCVQLVPEYFLKKSSRMAVTVRSWSWKQE